MVNSTCKVFIATSADGFIARTGGALDWLDRANASAPTSEDFGYSAFMQGVDAIVMGRATFAKVCGFDDWPYGQTPVYVLSQSMKQLPTGVPNAVRLLDANPADVVRHASAAGHARLYVDGGQTIQRFLLAGLIDEITVTVIPVLLGTGIPLFGPLAADVALRLAASRSWPCGFVQNRYDLPGRQQKA